MVALTGCVFQKMHEKTLTDLQEATSLHYSQQVLQTIVSTCDTARLPVFFRLENSTSIWQPNYATSSSAGGAALGVTIPKLDLGQSTVQAILGFGEGLSKQLNLQNFGAAAMTRVTTLYGFLCFPLRYGDYVFPHGTLYTVVDTADTQEPFLLSVKRPNGQYLGVTPARRKDFMRFAQDVTYWSQTAEPQLSDLISATGMLYRFSAEYDTAVANVVRARLARFQTEDAMAQAQAKLKDKQQAFDALTAEAKTSHAPPLVLQTLLQLASQELQAQSAAIAKVGAEFDALDKEIVSNTTTLVQLVSSLESILAEIKEHDSSLASLDTTPILMDFRQRLETIQHGDRQQLAALPLLTLPPVAGVRARETSDQLYRERFQSLPPVLQTPQLQRTQ